MSDLIDKKALIKTLRTIGFCESETGALIVRLQSRINAGEFDAKPEPTIFEYNHINEQIDDLKKRVEQIERNNDEGRKFNERAESWINANKPTKTYLCARGHPGEVNRKVCGKCPDCVEVT